MLDTAIVGGGVCGLALARHLGMRGRSFALYEARHRLGGRILTRNAPSGLALDLGPTWYWPQNQPLMGELLSELGLATFPQHDDGTALHLKEADKSPDPITNPDLHNGARRVEGGMAALVDALAAHVPEHNIHFGCILTNVRDCGDHVSLTFQVDGAPMDVQARTVVLALPPRLVAERIAFVPALEGMIGEALRATATWMAAQAKVAIAYDSAPWRAAGRSGNAFVTHDQAVLGEIYDACDAAGETAALGGFIALSPEQRTAFAAGLPMLVSSQMAQVFGPELETGAFFHHDWAADPFTCSALDREQPAMEHSGFSNPVLRRPSWEGKLHFSSSEVAAQGAGYLEGALGAARHADLALARARQVPVDMPADVRGAALNGASFARFAAFVAKESEGALDLYRAILNKTMAGQVKEQLTQLSVIGAMEEIYGRSLDELRRLDLDMAGVPVENGRSALMGEVQAPFRDLMQSFMDDVVAFNRTSCALSNFPFEHKVSREYMQTILRDVAACWRDFCLAANRLLLAKAAEGAAKARPQMTSAS